MSKKLSAVKKAQVSLRNRNRNRFYKSTIKTFTKKYMLSLKNLDNLDNNEKIKIYLSNIYSVIDKAVKRGILHKNTGARKKSKLAQAMQKMVNIKK